jgi:hypothetical protein
MTELYLKKHSIGLLPADERSREYLARLKQGQAVEAKVKRVRNLQQLRLWWALIGVIWEHQETYATKEQVHDAFKIWLGHYEDIRLKDGRTAVKPKSIAFGDLSQDAWEELFDQAIKMVTERIIPGVSDTDLRQHLQEMTGAQPA